MYTVTPPSYLQQAHDKDFTLLTHVYAKFYPLYIQKSFCIPSPSRFTTTERCTCMYMVKFHLGMLFLLTGNEDDKISLDQQVHPICDENAIRATPLSRVSRPTNDKLTTFKMTSILILYFNCARCMFHVLSVLILLGQQ